MTVEPSEVVGPPDLDLRLTPAAVAAIVGADDVSLVEVVQELRQDVESQRLALSIAVARLERLEAEAERRLIR